MFYLSIADPSDIASYYTALEDPSPAAEQTITTNCSGTGDYFVAAFATEPGVPGVTDYPAGTSYRHVYGSVSAGTAVIHLQLFTRDSSGVETLIKDEYSYNFTDLTATMQLWTSSSTGDLITQTDRLVFKLFVARVTGPGSITITTYFEGTANASVVQTTISVGAIGPPGPAGATGSTGPVGATGPPATLSDTGVTAGTYPNPTSITVGADGRITAIS
jgi:hypothetical protein